jgi:hypothetical protein
MFAVTSYTALLVDGFQRRMFPFLWIPKLSSSPAEVEVNVNLRPTIGRPVCLGVGHPSGTRDQVFLLHQIFLRQLRLCYFVAPSLTRGRVCNLPYNCFWAWPEQSLLGRSPAELAAIFFCLIWDSPTWKGRSPYLYPSGTGWLSYTPWYWVPFNLQTTNVLLETSRHKNTFHLLLCHRYIHVYWRSHYLATAIV